MKRGDRHFDDVIIYPRSGSQMCELDKIVANASKFYLIKFAENRHENYTGPNFVLFDICYNVTHVLYSWARRPIAFQSRILCKYCFCLKSGAVLALNLLTKTFILPTYFDFLKYIRIIIVRWPPF